MGVDPDRREADKSTIAILSRKQNVIPLKFYRDRGEIDGGESFAHLKSKVMFTAIVFESTAR